MIDAEKNNTKIHWTENIKIIETNFQKIYTI